MVNKPEHDETAVGKIIRIRQELQDEVLIQLDKLESNNQTKGMNDQSRGCIRGLRFALNKL